MASKADTGRIYRVRTLQLLSKLGYATTRQVSMGVIGECTLSARKMASRTIRWLLENGYVVERRNQDSITGERLIAVTKAGANYLAEHGEPLPGGKAHARDWLRHAHSHRTSCNSVFVSEVRGLSFDIGWSELEIRAGMAPKNLSLFCYWIDSLAYNKIPDIIFDNSDKYIWVEVENAWRGAEDFRKLIGFLRAMFGNKVPPVSEVWFVVSAPGAKTIGKRIRAAMTHHEHDFAVSRQVKELDSRILEKHIRVLQLDADTLKLNPVLF